MYLLRPNEEFPPVESAGEDGLLAIGTELTPERVKEAYSKGIFPWYDASQPVIWWSPDPRMVLFPENLKVSKSMKQLFKKNAFEVTYNRDFDAVITACAEINRDGQQGTWITPAMKKVYTHLHEQGWTHSVEVWLNDELVGGLYGIYLRKKHVFCGESMFSKVSNASKYGFIKFVEKLQGEGVRLIDCQVYTKHLESLGAEEIPREEFMEYLR